MIIINALKIELVIEPTSLGSILITLIVTMQILALALMVVVGRSHAWMHNSTANMTLHSRLVVLFIWQTGQTKANLTQSATRSIHIIYQIHIHMQMQAHFCTHYSLLISLQSVSWLHIHTVLYRVSLLFSLQIGDSYNKVSLLFYMVLLLFCTPFVIHHLHVYLKITKLVVFTIYNRN